MLDCEKENFTLSYIYEKNEMGENSLKIYHRMCKKDTYDQIVQKCCLNLQKNNNYKLTLRHT